MAKQKNNKTVFQKRRRAIVPVLRFFAIFFICAIASSALFLIYLLRDLPRPEKFTESEIFQSSKIYDRSGEIMLYELTGDEKRTYVPLTEISLFLQQAIVAAEDQNFYQHQGIDLRGIARAILYDLKLQKAAQGASTISQQLIRNYFLTANKTIKRKTREAVLSLELERRYEKEQILEWYLNLVPFGSNLYGAQAASQALFNKQANELTLNEAAALAALVKSPSSLWPYGQNKDKLIGRKDYVLDQMTKNNFITKEQADIAKAEVLEFAVISHPIKAPHFVMFVLDYLNQKYGKEYLSKAGLKIITSLDLGIQKTAEQTLAESKKNLLYYKAHNAALVALDPRTGELLAMVGSLDYFASSTPANCSPGVNCNFDPQVNVAISPRQPGSAFKPIAYATAFEKGFTAKTLLWDLPTEFNLNCSANALQTYDQHKAKCYHPENYDGRYRGQLTMKEVLAQSRNVPAVKTLYLAGIANVVQLAQEMGLTTLTNLNRYGLALVLGGAEVKLLEMVQAYGIFARDGYKAPFNFILQIADDKGNVLESKKTDGVKILSTQTARQINDILSDNSARGPMFGYNSALFLKDYQGEVAVKTGTTQLNNDGWAIGYSPNIVVGVWAGNNDNSSMSQSSVVVAAPVWRAFMLKILPTLARAQFAKPENERTAKPALNGVSQGPHSILHFVNKNDPQGPGTSQSDSQYWHWEYPIR